MWRQAHKIVSLAALHQPRTELLPTCRALPALADIDLSTALRFASPFSTWTDNQKAPTDVKTTAKFAWLVVVVHHNDPEITPPPSTSLYSTDSTQSPGIFTSSPKPLTFTRARPPSAVDRPSLFRRALLVLGGYYSKESTFMRAASHLYACVAEQALDAALLRAFDIPVRDFQHRHAMLCLHVWMLLVRLRPEGKDGKLLSQLLYEDFQEDVERQVRATGLKVRVSKHLTELEKQFYGSCVAYDRALKGESGESLSTALLRNVLQAAPGKESAAARLERYVRRELACLALTESEAVMMGNVKFSKLE